MGSHHWRTVLTAYADALETSTEFGGFIPEGRLPFPKEEIKSALIQALSEVGLSDENMKNQLEIAFLCLHGFVPEPESESADELERFFSGLEQRDYILDNSDIAVLKKLRHFLTHYKELHNRMARLSGQTLKKLRPKPVN